ncbi:MAG: hypothetical protein K4571_03420 [Deltaproteobacteria bacterium]
MAINDVSLTSGMRSNLLSLQNTVDLLNRTQSRLSTGKKVNSAMDNPVSFFASQALNSRASIIDSLKDAMGQAVQTITAADKGITAISSMIEQAKGIAQSALSAEVSTGFGTETVQINGLEKGDTIQIGATVLTAGPTAVATSTSYDSFSVTVSNTIDAGDTVKVGGVTFTACNAGTVQDSIGIDLSANTIAAGDTITVGGVQYTATAGSATTTYDSFTVDFDALVAGDTITVGGNTYMATAAAVAGANEFSINASKAEGFAELRALIETDTPAFTVGAYGIDETGAADADSFVIWAGTGTMTSTSVEETGAITIAANTTVTPFTAGEREFIVSGDAIADATALQAVINANQGTGGGGVYTVARNNDVLTITAGTAALAANTVTTSNAGAVAIDTTDTSAAPLAAGEFSISGATASEKALALRTAIEAVLGAGAYNIAEDTGVLTITAGTTALTAATVEAGTAAGDEITIASATTVTTADGALAAGEFAVTGDDVIDAQAMANLINNTAAITAADYSATASNGVLTISNSAATLAAGDVVVSDAAKMVETLVAADTELGSLQARYAEMLSQIDTLAADSGYKGKNLLDSDTLSVKFEGDHKLDVAGFNGSSAGLNITAATWTAGGDIDADITRLDDALVTLRSESSKLSGNLSVITVRQSFSTNMINTLTAGSDLLTAADANEEGANMLMLQTRQSLSTTALSLSAQAAQSVLRLFQ